MLRIFDQVNYKHEKCWLMLIHLRTLRKWPLGNCIRHATLTSYHKNPKATAVSCTEQKRIAVHCAKHTGMTRDTRYAKQTFMNSELNSQLHETNQAQSKSVGVLISVVCLMTLHGSP